MPVVGEAVVLVRVSSAHLGNDIRDAVQRGVRTSSGDIDREGNRVGQRFANGVGDGVREGRSRTDREAEATARSMTQRIERETNRNRPVLANLFGRTGSNMMSKFKQEFNLGIGAARMGPAVISALTLAGPSMLAAAGQIATALGGEIVSVIGAFGPGIAGALGVAAAGVATLGLNLGLLKLAFSGNTDSAKAFKEQLKTFKEDLTATFAPGVLSGFSDMVATLHDKLLPGINDQLAATGVAMGDVARGFATTVTSAENMSRIKGILATNTTFLGNFGLGLNGLTSSFLILFNAAKPIVDFIGEGVKRFGEWAQATLSAKEASGELGTFMSGLVTSFQVLWGIVSNFGSGIANIFQAAAPVSGTIRDNLVSISQSFKDWTGDSGNQARMTAFFEKAHELSSAIFTLIGKIATAWGTAFTNSNLDPLLHTFQVMGDVIAPAIGKIFNQIQAAAGPNLTKILDDIGVVFTNMASSGAIGQVAGMVSALVLAFTDLLAQISSNPIGAWLLGLGAGLLLFGGLLSTIGSVISALVPVLAALGAPVLLVAGAFALIYANSQSFRDAISGLVEVVASRFQPIWDALLPKLEAFWDKLSKLAGVIGDKLAPIIERLGPIVADAFGVIGTWIGVVVDLFSGFIDLFTALITGDWAGAWEAFKNIVSTVWNGVIDIISGIGGVLWGLITAIWDGVFNIISGILDPIVGTIQDWGTNIADAIRSFGNWIQTLWNDFWNWVGQRVSEAWNTISSAVTTGGQTVYQGVVDFGNWVQTLWNDFWNWVGQRVSDAWNAITSTVSGAVQGIYNGIVNFGNQVQSMWNGFWSWVGQRLSDAWNGMLSFLQGAYNNITGGIRDFGNWIQDIWNGIWNGVIDFLHSVWDGALDWLAGVWDGIAAEASTIWEAIQIAIVQPIQNAWNTLTGIFADIGAAVSAIVGTVSSAFDSVNSKYESMLATQAAASAAGQAFAASQGIAGGQVVTGGTTVAGRNDGIFGLAKGGVVQPVPGGRQFIIGEGRRPERVEPLDSRGLSTRDEALIKTIVSQMSSGTGGGASNIAVQVSIGERGLDAEVRRVITETQSDLARRIRGSRGVTA